MFYLLHSNDDDDDDGNNFRGKQWEMMHAVYDMFSMLQYEGLLPHVVVLFPFGHLTVKCRSGLEG